MNHIKVLTTKTTNPVNADPRHTFSNAVFMLKAALAFPWSAASNAGVVSLA
jgi:hypothetical protein